MNSMEKCALIIREICQRVEPGKKMIQKLLYLIERKGVNLDLNYSIHFFGPYSAKLDNALHALESYGDIVIDTSGMTHIIKLGDTQIEGELETGEKTVVDYVLQNFLGKTALELEAITTLDYAANQILGNKASDDEILEQVISIKGTKFTKEFLQNELNILKETSYID